MPRPKTRTERTRQELLASALRMLQQDGPVALSARRVAEAAGTSTAALYELFGDKSGLVRALYSEALALLDERQAAVPRTDDAAHDLVALLAATRRFAAEQPMLHQLLTGRAFAEFDPTAEDSEVARAIHRRGVAAVARYLEQVGGALSPRTGAELLVATHGGLLDAERSGRLGRTAASRDRRYRLGVQLLLDGLATTAAAT